MKNPRFYKTCLCIFLIHFVFFSIQPIAFAKLPKPSVTAQSAVIVDYNSGRILYSKNRNVRRLPASTLKLLTAMVALDAYPTSKKVGVSRKASLAQPSKAFLKRGETYSIGDLVKALVISSANDAAICIAEGVSGTELKFAKRMNAKARELGCKSSNFTNASGLPDDNQYTTAYDMARVTKAAYQYPFIRKCLQTKQAIIRRPCGRKITLKNHNKLLWNYPIAVYGKTGYTKKARQCFACVAQYKNKKVVMVMLKASTSWPNTRKLVQYGVGYSSTNSSLSKKARKNRKRHSKKSTKQIQAALKRAKCDPGPVDGVFGSKTVRAVMQFQRCKGLSPDGIVGPRTMKYLKSYSR